ncbi:MAG: methionyl-tRNA formyltransferase [Candidatus Paceibacterota bacterium]|jgi:methionyl-tRNA formyltransferase
MSSQFTFAFFGTPNVASDTLETLKQAGYLPSIIVTSPDARSGRKMLLTPSPVKVWAEENNISYLQPEKLDEIFYNELKLRCLGPNCLFIIVAYGKILPEEILKIPKYGSINIHYSLLPKYRGASPVETAILNGDSTTGVTIQKMVYQMDAGPIIASKKLEILPDQTAPELRLALIKAGGELLVETLPKIIAGDIKEAPQDEKLATHCKKIKKEDGLINLSADPVTNYNKFRAYAHWPRTFLFENGKRIIITDAVLENNTFTIKKVIPEGRKEITWEEFNRN